MSRRVSLNARIAHEAESTAEVDVVLVKITHPALSEPVRLSTDPTERLSLDPLSYCTRSTWPAEETKQVFSFVLLEAILPGDDGDSPHQAQLSLELHDNDIARVLRSITTPARVDLACVKASSPDVVEAEYLDLSLTSSEGDSGQAQLTIAREPLATEPMPADRMSRQRFPGLHS